MRLVSLLSSARTTALDLLFPLGCVGCGVEGTLLCDACHATLPWLTPPFCQRCAQPLRFAQVCDRCQREPLTIDGIRSLFRMEGAAREAVHRLKYSNLRTLAPFLGPLLAGLVEREALPAQVVVPVPLHPRRERERGYNQSALLARAVGREAGLPVEEHLLRRQRHTPPLARSVTAEERYHQVAGAFSARPNACGDLQVLLVDDVCTTGATLEACALALRDAGAASMWGVTVTREA